MDENTAQEKMLDKFSNTAKRAVVAAYEQARVEMFDTVEPRHLFIGILRDKKSLASRLLNKLGVDVERTIESLEVAPRDSKEASDKVKLSEEVKKILVDAFVISSEMEHVYVGTEHLLLSILKVTALDFVQDLENVGLTYSNVENALQNYATYHPGVFQSNNAEMNRSAKGGRKQSKNSPLTAFARNLNEEAKEGRFMPIYGRNEEIERMIHILSRKTKSNPLLVGEAGVGKSAIVEGLVQRIISGEVPPSFKGKEIISLDLAGILAGSKIRGDVEERILGIINEASENPDIILFIDEIHMIVGAGTAGQGSMDIANILKPYLTNSDISLIGATTLGEYQKYFETDSALTRRFQSILVNEIGEEESVKVLENIRPRLEEYHGLEITDEAIAEAVRLSNRYISDRFLPDKAIDVLDEAAAGRKISKESALKLGDDLRSEYLNVRNQKEDAMSKEELDKAASYRKRELELKEQLDRELNTKDKKKANKMVVTGDDVRKVTSRLTQIPVEKMDKNTAKALSDLDDVLQKYVIGQPDAIKKVSAGLKRARLGIGDQRRPLASFLFLGPTGVGKTELAKVVARELFGSENALIQIDMSEFMEQHSVSKLIGSPPGYVGYQEGGQLTEKIRHRPYSVILFDEIEKAHPELLNILLQLLEEGQLQDSKGRRVSFKNAVVIMTSNIGAQEVGDDSVLGFNVDGNEADDPGKEGIDKAFEKMREQLMEELKEEIKPELLNRIDDIIVFRGLDDQNIYEIAKLEVEKLNKRLREKLIKLSVSQAAIKYIAEKGFSKDYGARNIRRAVQEHIENPLAEFLLENQLNESEESIIKVSKQGDHIRIGEE